MSKEILLLRGQSCIVDNEDWSYLSQYKWYANALMYAVRRTSMKKGIRSLIYMHREILSPVSKQQVDHISGYTLDNRKQNLRICTIAENNKNRRLGSNNNSGYKGVHWNKYEKKWQARIQSNKKRIQIGYFNDVIEAAKAYDLAAMKYHGKFARLNLNSTHVE